MNMYFIYSHPTTIFRTGQITNRYMLLSCCISYTNFENNDGFVYHDDIIRGRLKNSILFSEYRKMQYKYICGLKGESGSMNISDGYKITNSVYELYLSIQENIHAPISYYLGQ